LRTRAAVRFGDASNAIITDTVWKDYVNEAYRDICSLEPWPFLEAATTNVSVTASTRSASLPTNVWRVQAVYNSTDNIPMSPLHNPAQQFWEFPEQDETGVATLYRIRGALIEVFPMPAATTTLTLHYEAYTGDLSADGDLPALPVVNHHVIMLLAVAKAYRDDGNFQAAQSYESEASVILDAMRRELLSPRTESYPGIVDSFFG
jgi:hypothetical protein